MNITQHWTCVIINEITQFVFHFSWTKLTALFLLHLLISTHSIMLFAFGLQMGKEKLKEKVTMIALSFPFLSLSEQLIGKYWEVLWVRRDTIGFLGSLSFLRNAIALKKYIVDNIINVPFSLPPIAFFFFFNLKQVLVWQKSMGY